MVLSGAVTTRRIVLWISGPHSLATTQESRICGHHPPRPACLQCMLDRLLPDPFRDRGNRGKHSILWGTPRLVLSPVAISLARRFCPRESIALHRREQDGPSRMQGAASPGVGLQFSSGKTQHRAYCGILCYPLSFSINCKVFGQHNTVMRWASDIVRREPIEVEVIRGVQQTTTPHRPFR